MKTANLAIVFTDIKGFTERTSRQTLEQNQRLLELHSNLLSPLFRTFGGRIIKSIGDSFLVTFESPTQAVVCGIAIQDRLWYQNRGAAEADRLDVRVAINVGEVRLESNDIFGEPVNIAARIEGITDAGEVYFTEAVFLSMNKAEVPAEEVGLFDLKGIPGKIKVYRVPRAPYRVEPQGGEGGELPPFGNLGLNKVDQAQRNASVTSQIQSRAAALGTRAMAMGTDLASRTGTALEASGRRVKHPGRVAALVLLVVLIPLVAIRLGRSRVDVELAELASAPEGERASRADEVRKLISAETDLASAEYDRGRLEQALGSPGKAIEHFRRASKEGHSKAITRLIDLLGDDRCRVRKAAAEVLGELRIAKARSGLEGLAKRSGDEGPDIPLVGCNSRRAAEDALKRLE